MQMVPAFYRHVRITPGERAVSAWVEDDFHHMGVTLHHDGASIRQVDSEIVRAPWSTCPGAMEQLAATFTDAALDEAATLGVKTLNCTHLYDMAVIAAAHFCDTAPTLFAISVSDAVDGSREAKISRDDVPLLRFVERDGCLVEPDTVVGKTLFQLGNWIAALDEAGREAARLLRWAAIIAHGRSIPLERQSDATRMPPNCFTFQEGRKERAIRIGRIVDFSDGLQPLGEGAAL